MRFILIDEIRRDNAISHLLGVNLNGKTIVDFRDYKADRSASQNNLMWMWYATIGNDIGYIADDLHEMMKAKIFGVKELKTKDSKGKTILLHVPNGTTTKLGVEKMTEFLQAIEMLAGELGIKLPYPDDYKLAMTGKK